MAPIRSCFLLVALAFQLGAQQPVDDPVLRARAAREKSGIANEGDLPPVPKGVLEPPPLPPPEAYERKQGKKALKAGKAPAATLAKGKKGKKGKATPAEAKAGKKKAKKAPAARGKGKKRK